MSIPVTTTAIRAFGKSYSVQRETTAGAYVSGLFTPGILSTISVRAVMMPLSGQEMLLLEEGTRDRERRKCYSLDPIYPADETQKKMADVVTVDGKEYQVETVENWTSYFKAILVRKNQGG